ncbi:DUF4157 domain-containing protein [Micromonospora sp. NPDC005299]|uniref:eCIS core domain-containing protein n=1 Tax=Micromonospora sp. NPDC005299 TaxID=3364231 RepID=UPI0036C18012
MVTGLAVPGPVLTLGARLDLAGRRLAVRHLTQLPWAGPLWRLLSRAEELSGPMGRRFERDESSHSGRSVGLFPGAAVAPVTDDWPVSAFAPGRLGGPARLAPAAYLPPPPDAAPKESGVEPEWSGQVCAAPESSGSPSGSLNPSTVARSGSGRRLPADVRSALRAVAGPGADAMVVHDDAEADQVARHHHADAVTVGRDVHLRAGRLRPDTADGFALLAHEATHVGAGLTGAGRRAAPGGRAAEEQVALAREVVARRTFGAAPATVSPPAMPVSSGAAAAHEDGHRHAMTAHTDRDHAVNGGIDVEELRRSLIGDLMRQLRSEFERGA